MSEQTPAVVAIFGSNDPREGQPAWDVARRAGATIASLGYTVANGGYGGTMEASARGAREAGGRAVGVTCSIWSSRANPCVDETIVTGSLGERLATLVELARSGGYVVLPGATGTLAELATVWEHVGKGLQPAVPIVCVGDFWRPLIDMMAAARPKTRRWVELVSEPEQLEEHFPRASLSGDKG
jgi:hypothetical protein